MVQHIGPEDHDPAHQENELNHADPGAGLEPAHADLKPDDETRKNGPVGGRQSGEVMKQGSDGRQLQSRVEGGVLKGKKGH